MKGERKVPKKPFVENDDPAAYETIMSSLKENNDDLNTLLNEVRTISDRIGDVCELTTFKRLEEKLLALQNSIAEFTKASQPARNQTTETTPTQTEQAKPQNPFIGYPETKNQPMVVKCNKWEEFQNYAKNAETVSFTYRETDRLFEADAVKENQIIAFIGEMPKPDQLLKMWLSGRLGTSEKNVFEGTITKA